MPVVDGMSVLVCSAMVLFLLSSFVSGLARLVRPAMRADARVARLVRDPVLVVPAVVAASGAEFLVALLIGARGAERPLQARLRRRVRVLDLVERDVGRT